MHKGIVYAAACLFLVVGTTALNTTVLYTPDSARYLAWAKSLAFFEGLQDDTGPEINRYVVRPPLYPLLLSPAARVFPLSLVAAKTVTLFCGLSVALLFYGWLRKKIDSNMAGVGAFLLCLNPFVLMYSTQVLSEIPFVACVVAFFLLLQKISDNAETDITLDYVLLIVITAALSIREAGLFLMLSAAVFYLTRRQRKRAFVVLLVPVLFYVLWVMWNEWLVASEGAPGGSNVNVLLARLYTTEDTSIFKELLLRVLSNFSLYSGIIGKLVFLSGYVRGPMAFVSAESPVNQFLSGVANIPVQLVTVFLFVYGAHRSWKQFDAVVVPACVFVMLYGASLLLFPVSDTRYLFPLLPVILYYTIHGIVSLFQQATSWSQRLLGNSFVLLGMTALLVIPNITWVVQFSSNNIRYHVAKERHFSDIAATKGLPGVYRRTFDRAGAWLVQQSPPETVVASRWKEVALWTEGRKILEVTPDLTVEMFDAQLRDYAARYLVSVDEGGLRDLELQMTLSKRFSFLSVFHIANVEIFEVQRKSANVIDTGNGTELQRNFRRALQLLRESHVTPAESLLQNMFARIGNHPLVVLSLGVAKEFDGQYAESEQLFRLLRERLQAGSMLQQAAYHLEMIAKLRTAESDHAQALRAALFQQVATSCRAFGFEKRAGMLLDRSLESDLTFFPALIFASLYAWEDGNIDLAHWFVQRALTVGPMNTQAKRLKLVVQYSDTLRRTQNSTRRTHFRLAIAKELVKFGTRNKAIDVLHELLREDENDMAGLRLLTDLYISKKMTAPAKRTLERLLEVNPADVSARMAYEQLDP